MMQITDATECNLMQHLTDVQQQAIALIASGARLRVVVETLGIRRETLWRWRQMPEFKRVYQERQALLRAEMAEQMGEVMRMALAALERDLARVDDPKRMNPLETAFSVLKLMQPSQLLAAPTEVETVIPPP